MLQRDYWAEGLDLAALGLRRTRPRGCPALRHDRAPLTSVAVVTLTGRDLTLDEVVAVARGRERRGADRGRARADDARQVARGASAARGLPTYGLTTGLGVQKRATQQTRRRRVPVAADRREPHGRRAGCAAATWCGRRCSCSSTRWPAARPACGRRSPSASREALNDGREPPVRLRGSLGASDLAAMADLAAGVFGGVDLAAGEGLALINSSAFGTGLAALALADAARLVDAADVAGALSLEGFAANLTSCTRRWSGRDQTQSLRARWRASAELLDGSFLWQEGAARNLQDPLTYRSTAPAAGGRAPCRGPRARAACHRAQLRPGQSAGLGGGRDDRLDGRVRGGGTLRGSGLRPDRACHHADGRLRAQRQAAGHALVRPAHRAARPGRARPRSEHPGHHRRVARGRGEHARPAGLVHPHEHERRRGHRGPRVPPASLGTTTGGAGRRSAKGWWRSSSSSPHRLWTCAAPRLSEAAPQGRTSASGGSCR